MKVNDELLDSLLKNNKNHELTYEETIEIIKDLSSRGYRIYHKAKLIAIAALEKQIKKKPTFSDYDDNGYDGMIPHTAKCPTCENEFEFGTWNEEENHHCVCGQAMDWSDI